MSLESTICAVAAKARNAGVAFNPPLSEGDVHGFEQATGITLPDDYRTFLLRVGNGGTGFPEYGLCRLGELPSDYNYGGPNYSKPFPFTAPWIWEDGESSHEGTQEDVTSGVLILGTEGCGLYFCLVVNGPEYGKVWTLSDVGITPSNSPMTFLEWYEALLDGKQV
jgi:hypothetical protein